MSRFLLGRIRKFDRSSGGPLLECGVWDRHRRDSELAAYRRRGEDAAGRPRSPGSRQRRLAFRRRTFVHSSAGRLSDFERTWPLAGGLLRRPGLAFFGEAARLHRGPTAAQSRHDDYVSPVVRGCDAPTQPSERASASSTTMKHGYYSAGRQSGRRVEHSPSPPAAYRHDSLVNPRGTDVISYDGGDGQCRTMFVAVAAESWWFRLLLAFA
jgi:hypothetical protein